MAHVGIVTQARMTSTRLAGKVLREVGGRTLLEHHLRRLEGRGSDVYVATTSNADDDVLAAMADDLGVPCFRGSESDVLGRFHDCAETFGLDVIVRVTSDCPLIDGDLVKAGVEEFVAAGDDRLYLSNCLTRTYPRGFDFEVFSIEALREANEQATARPEREHVTPYFYNGPADRMHLRNIALPTDKSGYRITVDTPEDLELIRVLIEEHGAADLGYQGIIDVLDANPELACMNQSIAQKKLGE